MGEMDFSADLGGSSKIFKWVFLSLKTEVEKGSIWTAFGYG